MKKNILLLAILFAIPCMLMAQRIGINTTNPQSTLDVNGDVIYRINSLWVDDSITIALDVNSYKFSSYRILSDSTVNISGITAGMDGRLVTLMNESEYPMWLHHNDPVAVSQNRILTGDGASLVLHQKGIVTLQYDSIDMKWVVNSSSQVPAGATVWDTTSTGIYIEEFVGIGTDSPTAPLTIITELDEPGFTHTAGEDSITVASSISELFGAVGTTSNHMFTLKSNNEGAVHVLPEGNVLLGSSSQASQLLEAAATRTHDYIARLNVVDNTIGYLHMDEAHEINISSGITDILGNKSGYFGTSSNHPFRLRSGNAGEMVHFFNTGQTVFGSIWDFADGKLKIVTPAGGTGFVHQSEGGIRFRTQVGQTSYSLGTSTPSNLRFITDDSTRLHIGYAGAVGIGTENPTEQLTVFTNGTGYGISHRNSNGLVLSSFLGQTSASIGTRTNHNFRLVTNNVSRLSIRYDGAIGINTEEPIEMLTINTPLGGPGVSQRSLDGTILASYIGNGAAAFGTWSNSGFRIICNGQNAMYFTPDGKVGIGKENPINKFEVNGTIRSKEIIVENVNWPDYVFADDYPLTSLHELEAFIHTHHHLPNIPSAAEVESNGQHVGEIQKKMMEKIEELTLHIIDLNKKIEALQQQVR